jgi:hypothetical protein
MAADLERIVHLTAAQSSKCQCDGNDEYDAGGNHQNLEEVIARSVTI